MYLTVFIDFLKVEHVTLTSRIGNLHAQDEDKCCVVRTCQVIANQSTHAVFNWNKTKTKRPSKIWNQKDQNENTSSVLEAVIKKDTSQN
jgi:hypothetical protein